jgi:flavodoxin-like protein
MRATVVYESRFGNTYEVAEAIAETLDAELISVDAPMPVLDELDLLVVGGPTHVHGMTGARSRASAADQGGTAGRGVRDWLDDLPRAHGHAVTFDTRFEKPALLTGSAAKGIAKRLLRKGFEVVATESFFVLGTDGPLKDGELDRAKEWAEGLRDQVQDVERLPVGSH